MSAVRLVLVGFIAIGYLSQVIARPPTSPTLNLFFNVLRAALVILILTNKKHALF